MKYGNINISIIGEFIFYELKNGDLFLYPCDECNECSNGVNKQGLCLKCERTLNGNNICITEGDGKIGTISSNDKIQKVSIKIKIN